MSSGIFRLLPSCKLNWTGQISQISQMSQILWLCLLSQICSLEAKVQENVVNKIFTEQEESCRGQGLENTQHWAGPVATVSSVLKCILNNSSENNGQIFETKPLWGYTIGVITAHATDPQQVRAQGPTSWAGGSKRVEVRCSCQELKPCQHWITTNEIRGKQLVESAVPCKIAKCWHKVSTPCWNQTDVSQNTATCLHH